MANIPSKPRRCQILTYTDEEMEAMRMADQGMIWGAATYRTLDDSLYCITLDSRVLQDKGISSDIAGKKIKYIGTIPQEFRKELAQCSPEDFPNLLKEKSIYFENKTNATIYLNVPEKNRLYLALMTEEGNRDISPSPIRIKYHYAPVDLSIGSRNNEPVLFLNQLRHSHIDENKSDMLYELGRKEAWDLDLDPHCPARLNNFGKFTKAICDGVSIYPLTVKLGFN